MKDVHQENMKKNNENKVIKTIQKSICLGLLLVFSICLLAGCRNHQNEPVEITMIHGWGSSEADHEAMRQIYMDFEKEHPEIRLNMISMPAATDVVSKMGDLLTVGQIPDIVFTAGDGRESIYSFMVEKGYAVNLIPYIEEDEEFKRNISPSILNYWMTEDGALYTVSDVLLMGGYWYNQELFSLAGITEPPKTWEDWELVCEKLVELSKHRFPKADPLIMDTDHIVYLTNAILCKENETALEHIGKNMINVQSPSFQTTLEQIKKISEYSDVVNTYSFRDALDSFNEGETAIYINGVWANSLIDPNLDVAYAAFPSKDGEGVSMISSCVGYILGNTGDEKRMNASVEFLKYMLSEPVAERILKETGQIPSNPNVEITKESGSERLYQAVSCVKEAGTVTEVPANLWSLGLEDTYGENVILYLKDKLTLEELQKELSEY